MSQSITIRNIEDDGYEELAVRAALTGHSLQEYLRTQLRELVRRHDPKALLARIKQRKQDTGSPT